MADYTWRQWEQSQDNDNVINQATCERWQAGIELAGGSWSGSFEDGKDSITIDEFNALEQQIQSKVSSYTPKNYDPDSTVQIVPGVDGWNKVEDGILRSICTPDGVGRNWQPGTKKMNISGWTFTSTVYKGEFIDDEDGFRAAYWSRGGSTNGANYNWVYASSLEFSTVRNKRLLVSFDWKTDDEEEIAALSSYFNIGFTLCVNNTQSATLYRVLSNATLGIGKPTSEWTRVQYAATMSDDFFTGGSGSPDDMGWFFLRFSDYSIYSLYIRKIKLEITDDEESTEWSPAPEDYGYPSATALSASPQSVEDSDEVAAPEADEIE